MADQFDTAKQRLFLPFLSGFYGYFAQPVGWLAFRIVIGGMFALNGWDKVMAPMAMSGFVEMIGFGPGWLFSPLLAYANFLGGLFIVFGFLTRPAALVSAVILAITYWFHAANPYGDAFLTAEGIAYLNENKELLTPAGQMNLLADGGAAFLNGPTGVQLKAELNSLFWTAGAAIIAALGGGKYSVDRMLMKREF